MDNENSNHMSRGLNSRIYFADELPSKTVGYAHEELIRELNNLANSIAVNADYFSDASWAFGKFCKSIEKQKELKIKIEDVL